MSRWSLPLLIVAILFAAGCTTISQTTNTTASPFVTVTAPAAAANETLAAAFSSLAAKPAYRHATWGVLVVDLANNTTLFERDADAMLMPGSTTKSFTLAAALAAIGPEHRFETPVYRVNDTLVLVASGDLSMGGRTGSNGTIDYTDVDHGDANALGGAELTPGDPLAGLRDLAREVKGAGIAEVADVMIDDRLFETTDIGKAYVTSPIVINDNVIDLTVTGNATPGGPATVRSRPETAAFQIVSNVTSTSGVPADLEIGAGGQGVVTVSGSVPAGAVTNRTFTVREPAAFARTLFIEALEREGVRVRADATGPNPAGDLLPAGYTGAAEVASFISPPFSGDVMLTLKVSQNLPADSYVLLIAAASGKRTFAEGIALERPLLEDLGVATDGLSLVDGEGSDGNRISPRAAVQLLSGMHRSSNYPHFFAALPVLGVDGSLASTVPADHPAAGRIRAKTGTTIAGDGLAEEPIVWAKALAGYADCASGRQTAFAITVNNVRVADIGEALAVGSDLAELAAVIQQTY